MCAEKQEILLDISHHYYKRSYINRCRIHGPNGVQTLTIPLLKGKHQMTPIRELRIARHEPWRDHHLKSLKTAYGSAPYFDHYWDELEQMYREPLDLLIDLMQRQYELLIELLELPIYVSWKAEYQQDAGPVTYDARGLSSPRSPYASLPAYPHIWDDRRVFVADLSLLDALFHLGPALPDYLISASVFMST